jgi:Zn-dependent membrane protease YugP
MSASELSFSAADLLFGESVASHYSGFHLQHKQAYTMKQLQQHIKLLA